MTNSLPFTAEDLESRANRADGRKTDNQSDKNFGPYKKANTFVPFVSRVESLQNTFDTPSSSLRGSLTFETKKGETKRLIDSQAAAVIAESLREQLAWDAEAGAWLIWEGDHWEPLIVPARAEKLIADAVEEGTHPLGYRVAYLTGIMQIITRRSLLPPPAWPVGVVPFANGLLNLDTRTLTPATPGYALGWVLPWRYEASADCPTIKAWLQRSVDGQDPETVELLRAWLAALVRGLSLQYFLTLIGRGGSGKGTFQRLAAALVGIRNVAVTDLARLENRPFETARLFGKRLCMINEAGKYGGSVDVLKAITGGDHIPLERKHVQQSGSFVFRGLVLMATNEPIIATDSTSGLERRRITVRFPYSATAEEKAAWNDQGGETDVLHQEIPGLIRWLLAMPVKEIAERLASPPARVVAENRLGMAAGNSVAEWMLEWCAPVHDDQKGTQIGVKSSDAESCLYPHYLRWCDDTGRSHPVSLRKFSDTVTDIGEHLGCAIRRRQDSITRTMHLTGLRLRGKSEDPHGWLRRDTHPPKGSAKQSEAVNEGVEAASRRERRGEASNCAPEKTQAACKPAAPDNTEAF